MDKSAIRNFAIEARKMLMKSAETEAGFYGVTKNGCKNPIQKGNDFEVYETIAGTENRIYGADIKRRANLVKAVETLGFEQVIEETAYTWFNRIIAIRFMEVNDYLPTRVRVLSSETGSNTPDIVTQSLDVDLNMTPEELEKVQKAKDENRYDDAFRMLFVKQCNELNAILPGLFEKTDDYMELLLKLSYTSDGVVRMLVDSIDENNFNVETEGQVEIIGWMYQYYNTELKDDTFAKLKKNIKITKERIPAATQLFTPEWIVRYMVENSIGRVWIEHLRSIDSSIDEKDKAEELGWKYYLPEANQEELVQEKLYEIRKGLYSIEPKDISCIDPCMGSGHVLVYMFDVLMDIYISEGYSERDAAFSILKYNITGVDIDRRAFQLSYFALMMKARGYNRTFFRGYENEFGERKIVEPKVVAIEESNEINRNQLRYFGAELSEFERNNAINQLSGVLDSFRDAREYGSCIELMQYDWELLRKYVEKYDIEGQISFDTLGIEITQRKLVKLLELGIILSNSYWAVITNPPYMGSSGMSEKLSAYVKDKYPNTKSDMSTVFMEKGLNIVKKSGYVAMINIPVWMFLSSYENLRVSLLDSKCFVNLLHLGRGVFGADFGTTSFVIRNISVKDYIANFRKLYERQGSVDDNEKKINLLHNGFGQYYIKQDKFVNVPGNSIAYSASEELLDAFVEGERIDNFGAPKQGLATADNNRFLRLWYEVSWDNLFVDCESHEESEKSEKTWYPYNKGGGYKKWYGNNDYVINWEKDGRELVNFKKSVIRSPQYYFRECLSWCKVTISGFSMRFIPKGFLFDVAGCSLFLDKDRMNYVLGFANSKVNQTILSIISPTVNYEVGHIASLPILYMSEQDREEINILVEENIRLSKKNWDSLEVSWDFKRNPLIRGLDLIEDSFVEYKQECVNEFATIQRNERRINELFIECYGMSKELTADVSDAEITYIIPTEREAVEALVSYAVGCMFGRYSLSKEGLNFAGGEHLISDEKFVFDKDNVIPITDAPYFNDDIVEKFSEWVKVAYGEASHEKNLEYIAKVLGNKGEIVKETIRSYFLNEFYGAHCSMCSVNGSGRRPYYWLFDSGKQNGFKCLIYMHRYNKDTLNLIRSEYLHKTEDAVENALKNAEYIIQTSASAVERAKATKDRDRYVKQLNEMRIYYQALSHLALQKIEIDLDDGVKHNYQLFQGVEVIADGGKKQKVDLLAKI